LYIVGLKASFEAPFGTKRPCFEGTRPLKKYIILEKFLEYTLGGRFLRTFLLNIASRQEV